MDENLLVQEERKKILIWRILFIVILIVLIIISILYGVGVGWKDKTNEKEDKKDPESILTLWKSEADSRKKLVSYMKTITDKSNDKYIPPESRIAVFDFDGTIFCETDTLYFDWLMYSHRVLNDTDYSSKATEEEKQLGRDIAEADIHNLRSDLQMRHARSYPRAYENMTFEQLDKYTKNYMDLPALGFNGMKRGEAFYEPMVELIEYLQANDFQVYLCSGSDRYILRTVAKSRLNLPESQIMGTIATVVATGQNNRSDFSYEYKNEDDIIMGGEFKFKNVKMNKISLIKTEIGKKPVLSFGNSSGDYSMAKYVTSNNPYESLAFMVCCDDVVREYGNEAKANTMKDKCSKNKGWVPISMRDDWTSIYKPGVEKKSVRV